VSSALLAPTRSTSIRPVTAKTAAFDFYDIESLNNVFTLCSFAPRTNTVEAFYLIDPTGDLATELGATPFDPNVAARRILEQNPAFQVEGELPRNVLFHDLSTFAGNVALARKFGLSDAERVNDPDAMSSYDAPGEPTFLRPVCDTDPGYDPFGAHPYFVGFNSYNYDTTMLAMYLMEAFSHLPGAFAQKQRADVGFAAPEASRMRSYNNELFSDIYRKRMPSYLVDGTVAGGKRWASVPNRIRKAMLGSGRHIDAARLNEAQQMVGLKRLLGGLGRQIMESDQLGAHNATVRTLADLYDLLAYNVSDVVGLAKLFKHPTYSSAFDLKKGLIDQYPETVYDQSKHTGQPNVHPRAVRRGRLTPDTSSAKLVGLILSPYGNLDDLESVSFMYPSEKVAQERGVPRVNVLDECRKFFYESITDEDARRRFDEVFVYYKSIEGKNFNDSEEYGNRWPNGGRAHVLKDVPKTANNLPYFTADGSPSTCFATFSTGGIHGAEADWGKFAEDAADYDEGVRMIAQAKALFPDARDFVATAKKQHNLLVLPDGTAVEKPLVLLGSDPAKVSYRKPKKDDPAQTEQLLRAQSQVPVPADLLARQRPAEQALHVVLTDGTFLDGKVVLAKTAEATAEYRDAPSKARPEIFEKKSDGSTKLKAKYTFTSSAAAIHEDFTSYYPNMLRNMSAFWNEQLGEDRYAKILEDKARYGVEMKDPSLSPEERNRLGVLRNGTKLILNSASGAGDTTHHTPIRVNNAIISMRIIGQLFSWRIGQAQTLEGARIISTNTDGLYSVLDEETNNRVLAEQQALINVEIEPEPLIIVSKDSNNRLELHVPKPGTPVWEAEIISASGGTLACHEEPQPTKSLAHPAVLDWALARYLRYAAGSYVPSWRTTPISLSEPLDRRLGKQLLLEAQNGDNPVLAARLFQNVIAASNGTITIPFAADPLDPVNPDPEKVVNPRPLQHYNRIFVVHPGKPGAVSLRSAGAWVVNAASKLRRERDGLAPVQTDAVALGILQANGFARTRVEASQTNRDLLPEDQDVAVRKITGIDPGWSVLIENGALICMPEAKLRDLLGCLDIDTYVSMLASTFEANWMNSTDDASGAAGDDSDED
jgi:hypothetical protein